MLYYSHAIGVVKLIILTKKQHLAGLFLGKFTIESQLWSIKKKKKIRPNKIALNICKHCAS